MNDELVNRRRSQGLNQAEMAVRAGVSKTLIIWLETGRLSPASHPSTLRKLADAYGVPISDIQVASASEKSAATVPTT